MGHAPFLPIYSALKRQFPPSMQFRLLPKKDAAMATKFRSFAVSSLKERLSQPKTSARKDFVSYLAGATDPDQPAGKQRFVYSPADMTSDMGFFM